MEQTAEWKSSATLDEKHKKNIKREIVLVALRNSVPFLLYALICLPYATIQGIEEGSWFLFGFSIAFAVLGTCFATTGVKRFSAISQNRFEWRGDVVKKRIWGGRYSHSRVLGNGGQEYYTQHILLSYAKESHIIGIKYLGEKPSLFENIVFMHDPVAYKVKENI